MEKAKKPSKADVADEKKGEAHYKSLAKSNPQYRSQFLSMAKDEAKHRKMLEAMLKRGMQGKLK